MNSTIAARGLVSRESAVLLMVSGGSDSTALARLFARLRDDGHVRVITMLHMNHKLRGADSDGDAAFVAALADELAIPLFTCEIDIAAEAAHSGGNIEAVARHERYLAAREALASMCLHEGVALADGRIATAHTADDRIENFYMRSIVGTGPGGFRGMKYANGQVVRPLLDCTRDELRRYLVDECDGRWREDATNAHTDRFRAYVRHEIVPRAREWNGALDATLVRSMNLIGDEDDMLDAMADDVIARDVQMIAPGADITVDSCKSVASEAATADTSSESEGAAANASSATEVSIAAASPASSAEVEGACAAGAGDSSGGVDSFARFSTPVSSSADEAIAPSEPADPSAGYILLPRFGSIARPLQRRVVRKLLKSMLGQEERIDAAAVETIVDCFGDGVPASGRVANIQGDLAVSSNKKGVRVEPMAAFRARRKRER